MIARCTAGAVALALMMLATAARADEIVVGAEMPLTGAFARSGEAFHEGVEAAVRMFNEKGGAHQIRLETIDNESTPAKGVSAVEELVSNGAVAIIGGYGSNVIGPASDTADKLGIVYITAGGVSDELTRRGHKTFFRINNNQGYLRSLGTLMDELKPAAVSIVYSTKEAPALLAGDLEKLLPEKGITVTAHSFDAAITDFKPIINKVKLRDRPDILLMIGYENDYVGIIRAAKVLKPDLKALVGVWSLATSKMAQDFPDLMPNVIGTSFLPYPVTFQTAEGQRFAALYKEMFGKEVEYLGAYGLVQGMVLFEAIARAADAGTLASGGLVDEMRKTDRDSILGRIVFDANGDNPNFALNMAQHRDGQIVLVSPRANATGPIVYPGVPW